MLSQKAFAVFCDEVVRDAGDKNEKLKDENVSLAAAYKLLTSFKLTTGAELVKDINILEDEHTEDDSHFYYSFEPVDVPIVETFQSLRGTISGVVCNLLPRSLPRPPALSLVDHDNEVLELDCFVSQSISAKGFIKNYSGTFNDVVSMVRAERHFLRFYYMGRVNALTGLPIQPMVHEEYLDNALISIHTVKIPKEVTRHIMNLLSRAEIYANHRDLRNELRTLRQVISNRKDIGSVETQHATLLSKNSVLKVARNALRTLEVSGPSGTSVSLTLDEGEYVSVSELRPSLRFYLSRDTAVIPLSSIAHLQVKVSGANLNHSSAHNGANAFISDEGLLLVRYSCVLTMGFAFDESLSQAVLDSFPRGGLQRYIDHVLTSSNPNFTANYQGPTPEFTLRLEIIDLKTLAIGNHLETLGINFDNDEQQD